MNEKQTQVHAGSGGDIGNAYIDDPGPAILPGLPGGPPLTPLLPADRTVEEGQEGDLVIFDDDDVRQALHQFLVAGGRSLSNHKRLAAMRTAMMFTLQLAAINLDIPKT